MQFNWWIGTVVSCKDPKMRRRVQVRIMGVHGLKKDLDTDTGNGIPDEDLPWCTCLFPVNYGGKKDTTPPPGLIEGAQVLGISTDGDAYQNNIILGSIPYDKPADIATNEYGTDLSSDLPDLTKFTSTLKNFMSTGKIGSAAQKALASSGSNSLVSQAKSSLSSMISDVKNSASGSSGSLRSYSTLQELELNEESTGLFKEVELANKINKNIHQGVEDYLNSIAVEDLSNVLIPPKESK